MNRLQRGTTTVEFALVGALAMIVLFGCIEFGRLLFVLNALTESTRVGARVAAVCPINHPAAKRVAVFHGGDGSVSGTELPDLTEENIVLTYLDADGGATAAYPDVRFVRVTVENYEFRFNVPFVARSMTLPPFTTTLPAESLGYVPELNARQCFGSGT